MKYLFTLIAALAMFSATSQTETFIWAETDGPELFHIYSTDDYAVTKDTLIRVTPTTVRIMSDTVLFDNIGLNLIAGAGIVITGTWPNFTISLEEPELAPGAPMKNGLEPFVLKVEYYDMSKNPLPGEPASGHFVVWNYMSDGTIKKVQVEKR